MAYIITIIIGTTIIIAANHHSSTFQALTRSLERVFFIPGARNLEWPRCVDTLLYSKVYRVDYLYIFICECSKPTFPSVLERSFGADPVRAPIFSPDKRRAASLANRFSTPKTSAQPILFWERPAASRM